ncbi:bZIP transcription factor [Aspergillus mulundensis]|uniref:Putative b-zip transcription factor n=1 Tax=Aspergillus mulundensis TaxID=1810919 RepID=A0A3D8RYC3_9EURO|nr:putative b-zip transcription factor [Aspergillus mulundensis]RDW78860.1 putative b-zip transcription factor [Aspergillus mulundensis]
METEFYNSINWALTTDSTDALFPWDVSPRSADAEGSRWGDLDPQLDQLLSASSYPLPEPPLQTQADTNTEYNNQVPLLGGLVLDNDNLSSTDSSVQSTGTELSATAQMPAQRSSRTSAAEPTRKRGRPRKLIDDAGVNPEERRRTQVRMAQRAYRSRKEASVSSLKNRINQLETAMKQISTAVISFGDDLVRSGALDTHPDLLKPLGNTVQACLALPVLPSTSTTHQLDMPAQNKDMPPSPHPPHTAEMSIPEFIDRLHVTCCYQAYLVTANPSIPQRRIERPFRILLGLMPRAFVAEFFKDWLLARAGHKDMAHWAHIPFFRVGGAGTHYPSPANVHHPFPAQRGGGAADETVNIQEDVAAFTGDLSDDEIEDVWFDLGDLQGYLAERGVLFPEYSMEVSMVGLDVREKNKDPGATSVARLMQALVRCAICLGRSPGFRRRDVQAAVDAFVAAQHSAGHTNSTTTVT